MSIPITALSAVAFTCYSLLHSSLSVVLWPLYSREVLDTSFYLIHVQWYRQLWAQE